MVLVVNKIAILKIPSKLLMAVAMF